MISLKINGQEVKGEKGQTILEIARENGFDIPTLCHDERVQAYGSCGLCVVEVEGWGRLVRSCATQAADGMVIYTDSERVKSSRRTTLEMLLSDHTGDCRPPCYRACPAQVDCQGYVGLIANKQYKEAVALLKEYYPIPLSIGLVCPHPCENACRRQMVDEPVAIANLKAFVANVDLESDVPYSPEVKEATGKKVGIVGAGPAGLTAAYFLVQQGHKVVVFDAMPEPGGMLRYGIPQYRLPKEMLDKEIDLIRRLGVEFRCNTRIPDAISLDKLRDEYDALFLGIGAWTSSGIRCAGEDNEGVIGGIDFLRDVAMGGRPDIGDRVAIIGGGNTAMDAARTAVRLGAGEVMVLYRRTRAEMPAEDIEIKEAEEEGVVFKFLMAPEEIIAENGRVAAIHMQKMQLGEPDASGRRRPVPVEGEQELIPLDTVIAAIGQQVNASGLGDVELNRWNSIEIDENTYMTNIEGVFAGGDGVTGPGIAIEAVAQGKNAAFAMDAYLKGKEYKAARQFQVEQTLTEEAFAGYEKMARAELEHEDPQKRRGNFELVSHIISEEKAVEEAGRCLECGCADYFECRLIRYARDYEVDPHKLAGDKHEKQAIEETPFFERDMNKCILCGLCVRVCNEVMGATALGLVHRGFDTVVQPEFGLPLSETDCISCGQCVALCPTGALTECSINMKNVPVKLKSTPSTCSLCSLACSQEIMSSGDKIVKIVPAGNGLLCSRGRFGWDAFNEQGLTAPLLREQGKLKEVKWDEALNAFKVLAAGGQTAVALSLSCTVEEAEAAAKLAQSLPATIMGSFTQNANANLAVVFGNDIPSGGFDKLDNADMVLMVGSFRENHIPAVKARKAAGNGAKLIIVSQETSLADDRAFLKICPENNDIGILKQVLAILLKTGDFIRDINGIKDLQQYLSREESTQQAAAIANMYIAAQNPVILIDGFSASSGAVQLLSDMAALRGGEGSIVVIGPGANARGVWQVGFTAGSKELLSALKSGQMRKLIIIGEDPVGTGIIKEEEIQSLDAVLVVSPYMTATAACADIVLPASSPVESSGTYINAQGSNCVMNAVRKPASGKYLQSLIEEISAGISGKRQNEQEDPGINLVVSNNEEMFTRNESAEYVFKVFKDKA